MSTVTRTRIPILLKENKNYDKKKHGGRLKALCSGRRWGGHNSLTRLDARKYEERCKKEKKIGGGGK